MNEKEEREKNKRERNRRQQKQQQRQRKKQTNGTERNERSQAIPDNIEKIHQKRKNKKKTITKFPYMNIFREI